MNKNSTYSLLSPSPLVPRTSSFVSRTSYLVPRTSSFVLLLSCFIFASYQASAQQELKYTNFIYNYMSINPGYAGSRDVPTISALYRQQWMGFKGAPVSEVVSFHSPFLSDRLGIGVNIANYTIGSTQSQFLSMAYAYSLIHTTDFNVRIGLQGSMRRIANNFTDPAEVLIIQNDPAIQNITPKYLGNFGMGLYVNYRDSYFGVSVPYYYSNTLGNNNAITTASERPTYYVMGGVSLPFSDKFYFKPAMLLQFTQGAPWSADFNVNFIFNDKVGAGLSYRAGKTNFEQIGESADLLLFYQFNSQVGFGAAYDFNLSPIKAYQTGSMEVVMRYDLSKPPLALNNPRTFF